MSPITDLNIRFKLIIHFQKISLILLDAQLTYKIRLQKEPDGGYTVTVPSLPECITFGNDIDEAIAMAKEAIELYIESLVEHGEEVPTEIIHLSTLLQFSLISHKMA